jgi:dihydroceramidase
MSSYLGAVALWFIDLRYCHFLSVTLPSFGIPNPELHAVWHVLVSFGFYLLVALVAEARLAALHSSSAVAS